MAEETPGASPEMTPAQARMAKARAARQANLANAPATEREPAPDTDTTPEVNPEVEELKQKLLDAETDRDTAIVRLEQALTPPPAPVVVAAPYVAPLPRNMRVERSGNVSTQYSTRWPQIRGGTCEFCGVLDPNTPGQYQYKLCPHFRGMQAWCTYCPPNKDPDEVNYHAVLNVATNPNNPQEVIMWCNSTECSDAHIKRFDRSNAF